MDDERVKLLKDVADLKAQVAALLEHTHPLLVKDVADLQGQLGLKALQEHKHPLIKRKA